MQAMKIRKCLPQDFESIYSLLSQLWPGKEFHKEALEKVFEKGLLSDKEVYYCVEIENKAAGFCSLYLKNSLWQEGNLGYIGELVIDKAHRGKGIGTELLKTVFEVAKEKGCKRVELDSAFSRTEALHFYENMGFEKRAYVYSKWLGDE
jgi:glucosamine-phosphate N-acetyltransferase